jgi:hypothetical protein
MSDNQTPPPIPQGPHETDPYQTPVANSTPQYAYPTQTGQDSTMRLLLPVGRSGMAITAGYLGLFSVMLVPAPFALLFGFLGMRDIRRSKDSANPKHGMGRCIFGMITGSIGTAFLLVLLFFAWKDHGLST